MNDGQRGALLIFISVGVLLLLVLGVSGLFLLKPQQILTSPSPQQSILPSINPTQSPSSTTIKESVTNKQDMQTPVDADGEYVDTKAGFSFTYPNDIEVLTCPSGRIFPVSKKRQHDPCNSDAGGLIIYTQEGDVVNTVPDGGIYYEFIQEDIAIGGHNAQKFKGTNISEELAPIPDKINYIKVLLKENKTLFIEDQLWGEESVKAGESSIANKIIPNIKIL